MNAEERLSRISRAAGVTLGDAITYHDSLERICIEHAIMQQYIAEQGLSAEFGEYMTSLRADRFDVPRSVFENWRDPD